MIKKCICFLLSIVMIMQTATVFGLQNADVRLVATIVSPKFEDVVFLYSETMNDGSFTEHFVNSDSAYNILLNVSKRESNWKAPYIGKNTALTDVQGLYGFEYSYKQIYSNNSTIRYLLTSSSHRQMVMVSYYWLEQYIVRICIETAQDMNDSNLANSSGIREELDQWFTSFNIIEENIEASNIRLRTNHGCAVGIIGNRVLSNIATANQLEIEESIATSDVINEVIPNKNEDKTDSLDSFTETPIREDTDSYQLIVSSKCFSDAKFIKAETYNDGSFSEFYSCINGTSVMIISAINRPDRIKMPYVGQKTFFDYLKSSFDSITNVVSYNNTNNVNRKRHRVLSNNTIIRSEALCYWTEHYIVMITISAIRDELSKQGISTLAVSQEFDKWSNSLSVYEEKNKDQVTNNYTTKGTTITIHRNRIIAEINATDVSRIEDSINTKGSGEGFHIKSFSELVNEIIKSGVMQTSIIQQPQTMKDTYMANHADPEISGSFHLVITSKRFEDAKYVGYDQLEDGSFTEYFTYMDNAYGITVSASVRPEGISKPYVGENTFLSFLYDTFGAGCTINCLSNKDNIIYNRITPSKSSDILLADALCYWFDHYIVIITISANRESIYRTTVNADSAKKEFQRWTTSLSVKEEKVDDSKNLLESSKGTSIGIEGNVITANVMTSSRMAIEEAFTWKHGGHGFAAEEANNLINNIKGIFTGERSVVTGYNNVKNGPDRIVTDASGNITLIQSKYYSTASKSVAACFDEKGNFRYYDANGNPMKIEVASDQYDDAVKSMADHIRKGQIKNVKDPKAAKDIIKKGEVTFKQAVNMACLGEA